MSSELLNWKLIWNGSELAKITKESIIKQLRERGLKVTPQRMAIIEVLIEQRDSHPGARLVYEEAKKKKKSVSLSTTYATLNELSRHGIIKTLQFDNKNLGVRSTRAVAQKANPKISKNLAFDE